MKKGIKRGVVATIVSGITVFTLGGILLGISQANKESDPLLIVSEERVPLANVETGEEANRTDALAIDGVELTIGAPALPVIAKLGTPASYSESSDKDRIYSYEDIEIATCMAENTEKIVAVFIRDEDLITPEGIAIGMPKEEMEQVYGLDYTEDDNFCVYERDGVRIRFLIDQDEIAYIQYISEEFD